MAPRAAAITVVVAAALALAGGAAAALTLTLGSAPSFTVTLSGADQTQAFTLGMTVSGGAAAGWNITASETPFDVGDYSLGNATITSVSIGSCNGGGCANPSNSVTWPIALSSTAVKIVNAAAGSGRGTDPLTVDFTLPVPGNAFAGAYTSTFTFAIASGP